jgi:hypothetical protein
MVDIEVIEIKLLGSNCSPLKAIASVRIREIVTHDWRIVKKGDEPAQVQVPQAAWRGYDGIIRYRYLLSIPKELKKQIDAVVLQSWEKETLNEKGKESQ